MSKKESEICKFEMDLKNFCLRSNLRNDDIITAYRSGLKTGVGNDIFWSGEDLGNGGGHTPTENSPPGSRISCF